ncbi:abc transporter family protein [Stylonychia lemnae]|uniref:Abc transporter family protein n=1 Tax=Stylonychia lemnae TaxID=5949 RepID=A0A078A704_STYLE|nr:abc transporter family protein [Stylonychia lemnae]|eukprot:CDW76556.1 abc transporter family protein [Stylonychia lemnae]
MSNTKAGQDDSLIFEDYEYESQQSLTAIKNINLKKKIEIQPLHGKFRKMQTIIQQDLISKSLQLSQQRKNPVKLDFENIEYEVTVRLSKAEALHEKRKTKTRKIIKGVSGYALPGQTLYIMGSSGAGKTSLLNILSDRAANTRENKLTGKVMLNDTTPLTQGIFGSLAGYVMQDDVLFHHYSPRQSLKFAARMKLNEFSEEEQDQKVEELLEELGLKSCADTPVGSVRRKTLSGGERKRTAIGVELITDPSLILLDEPTSGLDSFKALQIIKLLQAQANKGKTVISTIHQPSSEAFNLFDRLILMCDGFIVFQGEAIKCERYFNKIGIPCPKYANPADYYMRVLTVNYPKEKNDIKKVIYLTSSYEQILSPVVQKEEKFLDLAPVDPSKFRKDYAPFRVQLKELLKRCSQQAKDDPRHFKVKVGQTIFMCLQSLAIFWDLSGNDFVTQKGMVGLLFYTCMSQFMMNMMSCLLIFQEERPIFLREQANKIYNVGPYFLAKVSLELPAQIITPMLWTVIIYFGCGFALTAGQFFYFYLILLLLVLCASSFGYFLSSIFNRETTAVEVAPIILMPLQLFSGFYTNAGYYPVWISWFQYISPLRYALEALVNNEFEDRKYGSNDIHMVQFLGYKLGIAKCLAILAALTVFLRVLSMICLKLLVSRFQ